MIPFHVPCRKNHQSGKPVVDDGMCGEEHEILVFSSCSSRSSTTCSPELLPALFSAVSNLLFLLLRKMLFRQHVLCFVLSIPFCAVLIVRIVIPASLLPGLSRCCGLGDGCRPSRRPVARFFSVLIPSPCSVLPCRLAACRPPPEARGRRPRGREYCIGKAVGWRKMLKALARLGVRVFF